MAADTTDLKLETIGVELGRVGEEVKIAFEKTKTGGYIQQEDQFVETTRGELITVKKAIVDDEENIQKGGMAYNGAEISGRAEVSDSVVEGENTKVLGEGTKVSKKSYILDGAEISGGAEVSKSMVGGKNTKVLGEGTKISESDILAGALISSRAEVSESIVEGKNTIVSGKGTKVSESRILDGAEVLYGAEVSDSRVEGKNTIVSGKGTKVSKKSDILDGAEISCGAEVSDSIVEGENTIVSGEAKISDRAEVSGGAIVKYRVTVTGEGTEVSGKCTIVCGNLEIYGGTKISGGAIVVGNPNLLERVKIENKQIKGKFIVVMDGDNRSKETILEDLKLRGINVDNIEPNEYKLITYNQKTGIFTDKNLKEYKNLDEKAISENIGGYLEATQQTPFAILQDSSGFQPKTMLSSALSQQNKQMQNESQEEKAKFVKQLKRGREESLQEQVKRQKRYRE